jgi:hypothetical protein
MAGEQGTRDDPWQPAIPPVLEHLGLAEIEHDPRTDRMWGR